MINDPFGDLTDALRRAREETPLQREARRSQEHLRRHPIQPEDRPLPQIRGKQIDGVLYVRAADLADALEAQQVAPRLVAKLRGER